MKWVKITYDSKYEISENGDIKNKNTNKMLKTWLKNGYVYVTLFFNGIEKKFRLNRLVAIHFISNLDNYPHVNHIDGNKLNNNSKNLEWCTPSQNNFHAYKLGLIKGRKGIKNHCAKLTNEQIIEIRKLRSEGMYQKDIAKLFNVSQNVISKIDRKITWSHVK